MLLMKFRATMGSASKMTPGTMLNHDEDQEHQHVGAEPCQA